MKAPLFLLAASVAVWSAAAAAPGRPNVLFIAIDDLRNDLGVYGVAHARTPALDAFGRTARVFNRHYVQAPTCGASRFSLLSGRYPTAAREVSNHAIRDTSAGWAGDSLPGRFRAAGYRTLSLGKISHFPGNLTGKGWAELPEEIAGVWDRAWIPAGPWTTAEGIMHGYADGVARVSGKSPSIEAAAGPDEAYPDAWVAAEAVATLRELAAGGQPWFFGVGFFKPHLPFAAPQRWHDRHDGRAIPVPSAAARARPTWPSTWHESNEFRRQYAHPAGADPNEDEAYARQLRAAYAACVSYVDAQVGRVLDALRELKLEHDTIVVVWSDHGFLLGEHAIWGKHCLFDGALRSPLLIRVPGLAQPGAASDAPVETVDLLPTLLDLCGLPPVSTVSGLSLRPQLQEPGAPSAKGAHSFWTQGLRTIRTERWRLVTDPAGERIELFDYVSDPDETRNHAAEHPGVVEELLKRLPPVPAS